MLTHEELKKALKSDFAKQAIPTDAKRIIITLPLNLLGDGVLYTKNLWIELTVIVSFLITII